MQATAILMQTIALARHKLAGRASSSIGFRGSPWTLATYIVDGGQFQEAQACQGHDA